MEDSPTPLRNPLTRWVKSLTGEIATEILRLATSAFGLVAALAWNDAVQSVFKEYLPRASGIAAKFLYAILISVLIILITVNLTKLSQLAKKGGPRK